jgi:hypothetical protein
MHWDWGLWKYPTTRKDLFETQWRPLAGECMHNQPRETVARAGGMQAAAMNFGGAVTPLLVRISGTVFALEAAALWWVIDPERRAQVG